jgi:hypothetical protein
VGRQPDIPSNAQELAEIREALADAERCLHDARLLHALSRGPAPAGLEGDVAVLRAKEMRLQPPPPDRSPRTMAAWRIP